MLIKSRLVALLVVIRLLLSLIVLFIAVNQGRQTFWTEGRILKNVAAEGHTLSLQSRKIFSVCR